MDNHSFPFLSWSYFHGQPGKGIADDLRQSLVQTTLEIQSTRIRAQEESKLRDDQIFELRQLLVKAIRERDAANDECQRLVLEKLLIQHKLQNQNDPFSGISGGISSSSSECEESIVSCTDHREMPEKGRLLEAVMKAGPLLQTLLLAGPLPRWRHPPPPLEIPVPPPAYEGSDDSSTKTKYRRLLLQ